MHMIMYEENDSITTNISATIKLNMFASPDLAVGVTQALRD